MNPSTAPNVDEPGGAFGRADDGPLLSVQEGEAIVRIVESAPRVMRRSQFFVWTQSQMQALLPHEILACGAYHRQRRELVFEVFHNVVLLPQLLQQLGDGQGALLSMLAAAWIAAHGRPLQVDRARLQRSGLEGVETLMREQGIAVLLVHGVARPQRIAEIESLFVLAGSAGGASLPKLSHLDLMLPHLHATWQRVASAERKLSAAAAAPAPAASRPGADADPSRSVTARERQILSWVRAGHNNHQIAEELGISPLTVKNHIQKILRKLQANNRAQAVAEAMSLGLLDAR